jgi:uncharacterized protein (DUF1697 family)
LIFIALIRGINLVGRNKLPMASLRSLLEQDGCVDVRTYIQSGNAIFRTRLSDPARVAKRLSAAIAKCHGFEPRTLVLTIDELDKAAAGNPFPQADADPRSVHVFFLAETPAQPDLKKLDAVKTASERYALKGRAFYLHTPDGFGTSKLAERVEKALGVAATARNWRTVTTLIEMARLSTQPSAPSSDRASTRGTPAIRRRLPRRAGTARRSR